MTTVYTRAVHGQLTHTEMDANINNLNSAKYESGNDARFNHMDTIYNVCVGGGTSQATNNPYNSTSSTRLFFGQRNSSYVNNYNIGTNLNNYGGNYTKLDLSWYTGIRIGAQTQYGGIRFYDTSSFTNELLTVGKGSTNVVVANNFYAARFYDANNSGYYLDPASTSTLNTVNCTAITGDGSGLTGVGGSTTAGAVGTYLLAVDYTGAIHTVGNTVAGSTLGTWELYSSSNRVGGSTSFTAPGTTRAYAPSGTWQWMSAALQGSTRSRLGLAVRIS